ncbi:hypothetical protein FQR65_LT18348 [Abscondita terminalis]|nr:hypothetical protein FQR65_LT18348 [Abscondita terminalis]
MEDSNPIQALRYAEEAYNLARKINYNKGIAPALISMAALQMYLGEYEKALKSNQTLIKATSRIHQLRLKNQLQQREAEEKTKELMHQYQLSESELKAIRSQMNPHFIFNVLTQSRLYVNGIMRQKKSVRLIQKFAALDRLILENSSKSLVTADKEWKALTLYTELEATTHIDGVFTYHSTLQKIYS